MKKYILLILFTLLPVSSMAYIPNLQMIFERTAENNGHGFVLIDQEVILPADPKPYVVREQWLIENENILRVRVQGEKDLKGLLDMTIVYNYNRKYLLNEKEQKVTAPLSDLFLEPLFHFRKVNYLKNKVSTWGIAPAHAVQSLSREAINHSESPYLRLSRSGGTITYFIGTPSTKNSTQHPGLWIEQDQFVLRKLRLQDGTEVVAKNYKKYGAKLRMPRHRTLSWKDKVVQINLRSVRSASSSSNTRERLTHQSLNAKKEPHLIRKMPEIPIITEFYNRFR